MSKQPQNSGPAKIDPVAKFLAVLISLSVISVGVVAIMTLEAPSRSTRFGTTPPLYGNAAFLYGVAIICIGLLPLGFFAKTPRQAAFWVSGCALASLITVFFGKYLWG